MNNEYPSYHAARAEGTGSNRKLTAEQLARNLREFTGAENYYRHGLGIHLLTDGVKYLADHAECFWLIDAIGSYQGDLAKHRDYRLREMQFWTLNVYDDRSADLICVADSGEHSAIRQRFEWTDFPLRKIQIWIAVEGQARIALLPSEY